MEQNFGNLEKQPKCSIRPDILPIALGEKKNVEQFRFVHQGYNVVRVAHIGQVTMWPTYWKPFQGATKLDLVSQTECEMAISQKSQLSHLALPQEVCEVHMKYVKKFIFILVSELDQENFREMGQFQF